MRGEYQIPSPRIFGWKQIKNKEIGAGSTSDGLAGAKKCQRWTLGSRAFLGVMIGVMIYELLRDRTE